MRCCLAASKRARIIAAYELVDWLRLVEQPLGTTEIRRLASTIVKLHAPMLEEFAEYIDPANMSLWNSLDAFAQFLGFRQQ